MSLTFYAGCSNSGDKVYISGLSNPHVYLSGRSGSGKSHFLRQLVDQAAQQKSRLLVFASP